MGLTFQQKISSIINQISNLGSEELLNMDHQDALHVINSLEAVVWNFRDKYKDEFNQNKAPDIQDSLNVIKFYFPTLKWEELRREDNKSVFGATKGAVGVYLTYYYTGYWEGCLTINGYAIDIDDEHDAFTIDTNLETVLVILYNKYDLLTSLFTEGN
jgi:hypothetical protein